MQELPIYDAVVYEDPFHITGTNGKVVKQADVEHALLDALKEGAGETRYRRLLKDLCIYQGNICAYCANFRREGKDGKWFACSDTLHQSKGIPQTCKEWKWRGDE